MFPTLIILHSLFRWCVLLSLMYAIIRAAKGYFSNARFSSLDNHVRHWTATIAHIQLILGILLLMKSPLIHYYFTHFEASMANRDLTFFGIFHWTVMIVAIVVITIGSAKAKRKSSDIEKFGTMLLWFSIALVLILIAIPWPFSPWAERPLLRTF